MNIKKSLIPFAMSLILTVFLLTGCGGNDTTGNSAKDNSQNTVTFNNTTLTGTVTSIDGNTITLALTGGMRMGGEMKGGMPDGNPPENNSNTSANNANTSAENPTDTSDEDAAKNNTQSQTPPEKPEGDNSGSDQQTPPEISSGSANENEDTTDKNSEASQKPDEINSTTFTLTITDESVLQDISLSDITEGSMLTITFGDDNTITSISLSSIKNEDEIMEAPGSNDSVDTGTGATTITEDRQEADISYNSENTDENALRVEGSVTYSGTALNIHKSSGDTSNTESSDFYGLNAGFLNLDGASTTLTDSVITTNAQGANGIFAYGSNTNVTVSNTSIVTSADNSGGIDVTGGASIQASNLNIETNGQSSAAIRSDRGGGTLNVSKGTYTTNGTGSPAIYCTADITVTDATLTATASEGVVIEGKNSVTLKNCDVTGNMQGTYQDDETENLHTIMIYQSMSGDAEEGEANLTVNGGSITGQNGDLFYSTNTSSVVKLENVSLTLANDTLLRVSGNDSSRGWGTSGSNGADMKLYTTNQKLNGKIVVDDISSLSLSLSDGSVFEGSINEEQEGGTVNVSLDSGSTWKLTADSYISSFEGSMDNVDTNGYTLYVDGTAQ